MKVLKIIGLMIVTVVLVLVIVGLFLPTNYAVSRSVVISSEASHVHEYVNNLEKWEAWEPWKEADPTIVTTLGEKTFGVGASQSWTGAEGSGSLKFISSSPTEGVAYDLYFDNQSEKCDGAMMYETEENNTKVIWKMSGDMNMPIAGGYLACMMDEMVGPMFERGLDKLKTAVETHQNEIND